MIHRMKLQNGPFERIAEGTKTVEMRLYDEKRRMIAEGDTLLFESTESGEQLVCRVLSLCRCASFAELYARHDKVSLGYEKWEEADPRDMYLYYTSEEESRYGVVGIRIEKQQ